MKIFIDIGHPAQFHFFRNFINLMIKKGHEFFITARNKDVTHQLLKFYNIPFYDRGKGADSIPGKIISLVATDILLFKLIKIFKPDLCLSFSSPYLAQVSWLLKIPSITFEDTEPSPWVHRLYKPFTNYILTPTCFNKNFGKKHIHFNSYKELAYLHPNYYLPNDNVLVESNLKTNDKYIVIRFISWKALHDKGNHGLTLKQKIELTSELSKYAKIFISSEDNLPQVLENYAVKITPERLHDLLFYSSLYFGESSTMAAEAAILGIPVIYLDKKERGYTEELRTKYGLICQYSFSKIDFNDSVNKAIELLHDTSKKSNLQQRCQQIYKDKIDVNIFLVWLILNFPDSFRIMKSDSEYQIKPLHYLYHN